MIMVNFHRAVIGQHEGIITFLGDLGLSAPPKSFTQNAFRHFRVLQSPLSVVCLSDYEHLQFVTIYTLAVGCPSHLPVFDIFHIFYRNHYSCVTKMHFFFGLRGAKKCHFLACGVRKKSGRVGNPVKELEMKSSLSLY